MPICHPAGPAGAFSTGEQIDIRCHHRATKIEHHALIEVKPNEQMLV